MDDKVPPALAPIDSGATGPRVAVADDDEDLLSYDPQWCLFWAASVPAFHLDIWLPYLRRSRYRFVLMAGEDRFSDAIRTRVAGIRNVRILEPYEQARAWLHLCQRFQGVLYVVNRPENLRLANTFRDKAHVFLGHGESDKRTSGFRAASLYDSLFMARYASVERFPPAIRRWVGTNACAIGAPIPDGVTRDPWSAPRPIRTILYAPTWEGHSERGDYSSLPEVGPALVEAMPSLTARGTRVILRPHPMTGTRIARRKDIRDALFAAGAERGGEKAIDFAAADVLVSDISGVTAEFLFTEKPALMPLTLQLGAVGKDATQLDAEHPWVDQWLVGQEDLVQRLDRLSASDTKRSARARAARSMFRGHRTLEEAVASFDLALESVGRRGSRIPVRWVYEAKRRLSVLRERP